MALTTVRVVPPGNTTRRLRILIISGAFYPKVDGSAIAVGSLVKALLNCGHSVTVLTRTYPNAHKDELLEEASVIRVRQPGFSLLSRVLLVLNQAITGRRLSKVQPFDVIHAHGFSALAAAEIVRLATHTPCVVTFHGMQRLWAREAQKLKFQVAFAFMRPIEGLIARRANLVIAQSGLLGDVLSSLYRVAANKLVVIPNPVDIREFQFVRPAKLSGTVLFVGALGGGYDVGLLLRAAKLVLNNVPEARFVIVGGGPQEVLLRKLVSQLGIDQSVEFLGPIASRSRLASLYASSQLLVIPFRASGYILPLAALESMAIGRPVIATMVLERTDGVICARANPADLALAISKGLALELDEYQELATAARRFVERTSDSKLVASQLASVYAALLANLKGRRSRKWYWNEEPDS
jgi:glycosyltransferase involved in cell wall biosynthesis